MLNIILCGAPGSGKGTQSDFIVEKYGLQHLSTGDVLRAEIKSGSALGQEIDAIISKGNLVPDEKMIALIENFIASLPSDSKGVIFDGFPRTIPQAEALKVMLDKRGHKVAAMIELDVPDSELTERLIKRGKESGRSDDNADTIKKRLTVYHNQTAPLSEWYEKEGLRHHINGLGALERIFGDICNVIDNL